ncbi:uncharacterized protein BKA55DRAFT_496506, partial [Fusarium redolens]
EKEEAIPKWLSPIEYSHQQRDYNRRLQEGEGQWFVRSPEFQRWIGSRKQTLFFPGTPGVGKTILTSRVIDELYKRYQRDPSIGFAYLYYDYRRQDEQDIVSLLASLLKQLSEMKHSLPEEVQDLYGKHKNRQSRPSLLELVGVLKRVIWYFLQSFIIIDALDEWQVAGGCRNGLLSEIFQLAADRPKAEARQAGI